MSNVEMHAIVYGNVQGVGFRATTCSIANELRLTGTVRNMSDGSVEIYAQGSQEVLLRMIDRLKAFFGDAYIHQIQHSFSPIDTPKEKFVILR